MSLSSSFTLNLLVDCYYVNNNTFSFSAESKILCWQEQLVVVHLYSYTTIKLVIIIELYFHRHKSPIIPPSDFHY